MKIDIKKAKANLLKKLFFKMPTTIKEVEKFEKENNIENIKLLENLKDPMQILKEDSNIFVNKGICVCQHSSKINPETCIYNCCDCPITKKQQTKV